MPEGPALDPSRTVDHVPAPQAPSTVDDTGAYQPAGATAPYLPVPPVDAPSIPGYRITAHIARGGMGRIYAAHDLTLDREVALKTLLAGADAGRFVTEAKITARLPHPSIPPVHALGTLADGTPYLAMKLIRGRTLADLLKERPSPLAELPRFVQVFEQIAQAVGFAHAQGIIHRDLKPLNVMVGAFGEVQVMDWGLAKDVASGERERPEKLPEDDNVAHTAAGTVLGTPGYMAPEQARGEVVDARADVFALGATLAAILTGQPAFVGTSTRQVIERAARADLAEVRARLTHSGADSELIALALRCLSADVAERPVDGRAVASEVAAYRAGVEARLKQAETERAEALGREGEQRKRRRTVRVAGGVIALVLLAGLSVSLWQMFRAIAAEGQANLANADLAAKNTELDDERAKVEARFELAQKAITLFHTGVSEDMLLKNAEFKGLRTKLLKEAAGFYDDLKKLLAGQTDAKSRKALAAAYFQLGELTDKIGDKKEALAVHRKALALRRELVAAEGADVETRLDVARSLHAVGSLLQDNGAPAQALSAFQEQRDLAAALEADSPTDTVRVQQAFAHADMGFVLEFTGKPAEALDSYRRALAIFQKLPEGGQYLSPVSGPSLGLQLQANTSTDIGRVLCATGKVADGLESLRKGSDLLEKLAKANPDNILIQMDLARSHGNISSFLGQTGRPDEAMAAHLETLAVVQKLAKAHSAVTAFQQDLAICHGLMGDLLSQMGKPEQAMEARRKTLAIFQKMADDNPTVPDYQRDLATAHNNLGRLLAHQKRFAEAFTHIDDGLAMRRKLAETDPKNTMSTTYLGFSHAYRGWALVRSGQPARATADLRRALELWAQDAAPEPQTQFERSRALALLAGLGGEAKSGVTKDEAAVFAGQAVTALRDAINAGWGRLDELKEPDFDAVRGRDDFKKLLPELEAKVGPKAKPKD